MPDKDSEKLVDGIVIESLPSATFKVKIGTGKEIFAYLCGKMRMNYIKVLPGDRVMLKLSVDGEKGRIVKRL